MYSDSEDSNIEIDEYGASGYIHNYMNHRDQGPASNQDSSTSNKREHAIVNIEDYYCKDAQIPFEVTEVMPFDFDETLEDSSKMNDKVQEALMEESSSINRRKLSRVTKNVLTNIVNEKNPVKLNHETLLSYQIDGTNGEIVYYVGEVQKSRALDWIDKFWFQGNRGLSLILLDKSCKPLYLIERLTSCCIKLVVSRMESNGNVMVGTVMPNKSRSFVVFDWATGAEVEVIREWNTANLFRPPNLTEQYLYRISNKMGQIGLISKETGDTPKSSDATKKIFLEMPTDVSDNIRILLLATALSFDFCITERNKPHVFAFVTLFLLNLLLIAWVAGWVILGEWGYFQ